MDTNSAVLELQKCLQMEPRSRRKKKHGSFSYLLQGSPRSLRIAICPQTSLQHRSARAGTGRVSRGKGITLSLQTVGFFQIQPPQQLQFLLQPDGGAELKVLLSNSKSRLTFSYRPEVVPKNFPALSHMNLITKPYQGTLIILIVYMTNLRLREAKQLVQQVIPNICGTRARVQMKTYLRSYKWS